MPFLYIEANPVNITDTEEPFQEFVQRFVRSASFQYERIKFPLKTPISLRVNDNGDEREFPFTKEMWPLLNEENLKVERIQQEEGGVYVGRYIIDEKRVKEFQAGYEESEVDLRVRFELDSNGKWYVTDAYTAWYAPDIYAGELKDVMKEIAEENKIFLEQYP